MSRCPRCPHAPSLDKPPQPPPTLSFPPPPPHPPKPPRQSPRRSLPHRLRARLFRAPGPRSRHPPPDPTDLPYSIPSLNTKPPLPFNSFNKRRRPQTTTMPASKRRQRNRLRPGRSWYFPRRRPQRNHQRLPLQEPPPPPPPPPPNPPAPHPRIHRHHPRHLRHRYLGKFQPRGGGEGVGRGVRGHGGGGFGEGGVGDRGPGERNSSRQSEKQSTRQSEYNQLCTAPLCLWRVCG